MSLLSLNDIHVSYGSVEVLHGINLQVDEGEIVTILGANGAGKSTTLLTISGLVRPGSGEIVFDGKPLLRMKSHCPIPGRQKSLRTNDRVGKPAPWRLLHPG